MDGRPPREESESKDLGILGKLLQWVYRPLPLIVLFSLLFLGLAVGAYFLLTAPMPSTVAVQSSPSSPQYEEEFVDDLEEKVKRTDFALLDTLAEMRAPLSQLSLEDVDLRTYEGRTYHYQVLRMPEHLDREDLISRLSKRLTQAVDNATIVPSSDNAFFISIGGVNTHKILFEPAQKPVVRPHIPGPKLVVVIDDIGENLELADGLSSLELPLTFAVWPFASHTVESVALLQQRQREILIHFPMEPQGYPTVNPGKGAVFTTMTDQELMDTTRQVLDTIPTAIGVNNHMGSRFTEDAHGLSLVMTECKARGLFFLDSRTTPHSAGPGAARQVNIPFYQRDVFLDNVKEVTAILHQLRKAESIARKTGQAIAIGHPYQATLDALSQWGTERDMSVTVLPLSHLTPQFGDPTS